MLNIKLSKIGRKNKISYRIVVASSKSSKNSKFIEKIGFFNPFDKKNQFNININRFIYWKKCGSKISNRVKFIINKFHYLK
ncbi:30S ribosomal protein S16 [endosymbiont of Euscepes postfasciatus]|uniref:30S ribosomal protein S16 n=1 Tax=endosymbiont of Euscepes postfasciatus TaxID=650377 RepID=UPI000DC6F04B|nr:30S ribosomal protein S16 [endosymbiont of Euscepes postfasciatus]BBA84646.1 30S ribosomal protein S16 [endosymbiont of Euscepes postfasciatus]